MQNCFKRHICTWSGEIGPCYSFDRIKNKSRDINYVAGEPDFVNPNSFATINEALQNIGHRTGIKKALWW